MLVGLVLAGLALCLWLVLDGLVGLVSGRRWLGLRRAGERTGVRRTAAGQMGMGVGLGIEVGMIWAGDHTLLPGPAILAVAGAGVALAVVSAAVRWPGRPSAGRDTSAAD